MANGALITPRLSLEPWTDVHTDLLVGLSAQPEVVRYVATGEVWARERAHEVAQRQHDHWHRHGFGWRAAVDRETGDAIGFTALNLAGDLAPELDPDDPVVARIHPDNKPSLAVASALSLAFESQTAGTAGQPVTIHRLGINDWGRSRNAEPN